MTTHRNERALAFMIAGIILVSLVDIVGLLIAGASGATVIWPIFGVLPLIGFPIAILLIIALIVVSALRRGREARLAPTKKK